MTDAIRSPRLWKPAALVGAIGLLLTVAVVAGAVALANSDIDTAVLLAPVTGAAGLVITGLAAAMALNASRARQRSRAMSAQVEGTEHALTQSEREIERFATIAAHDLQEPLRTIISFTGLLERRHAPDLAPEAHDYLIRVAAAAERMRALIEDLLVYARIGQAERQFEAVDLRLVIDEVLDDLETLLRDNNAKVEVGDLPTVFGNAPGLGQVFTNLISNAVKYRLGDAPRVRITAQQRGRDWVVAVADNGKGIDPANHERIFELFRRLESRGVSGTGLGLAICARVIDLHGGRIWVRSAVGQGATFYFTIPIRAGVGTSDR
jgi:signal transduction histidine kinase